MEEQLYVENIIMSPGKLSLVKDVTKEQSNIEEQNNKKEEILTTKVKAMEGQQSHLENIFMSPTFGLHWHFSKENMTMFPSLKHTPFFGTHYKDIKDKTDYLQQIHCKYKTIP